MSGALGRFLRRIVRAQWERSPLEQSFDVLGLGTPLPGPVDVPALISDPGARDGGTAAALAMTFTAYGHPTTVAELDAELPMHDRGRNAHDMVEAAQRRGLAVAGVMINLARDAAALVPGDILHVEARRFVVVVAITGDGLHILDPEHGARVLTITREAPAVALLFAADETAMDVRRTRSGFGAPPPELPRAVARRSRSS